MKKQLRKTLALDCALLLLAAIYFCHRFYGIYFPLEGDAPLHLYYRLNADLMWADYTPYQWYYFTWMPANGLWSPLHQITTLGIRFVAFFADDLTRAFLVNFALSGLLLWAISAGAYSWLRQTGATRTASLLGAIGVTYTGYQMIGVYEFDHMYLISLAAVFPLLYCFQQVLRSNDPRGWVAGAALCIGFSLWGGSNTPMFFYLPFFLLLPFFDEKLDRPAKLKKLGWLVSAVAGGGFIGAASIVPGIFYVGDTLRAGMKFDEGIPSITLLEKLQTLFLRDWAKVQGWHYHETDYFLGLPVLILTSFGIYLAIRSSRKSSSSSITKLMGTCLVAGVILSHFSFLPGWIQSPIALLFEALSIRHPNRLFCLALLPAAFFSARALVEFRGKVALGLTLFFLASNFALIQFVFLPASDWVLPDVRMAALLSLSMAFLAAAVLALKASPLAESPSKKRWFSAILVALVFAMYAFAPVQSTRYAIKLSENAAKLATLPEDRLDFDALLGLRWNYPEVIAQGKKVFLEAPTYLADPRTRNGRVLDTKEIGNERTNFFAPRTGHRFAFSTPADLASPTRVKEIIQMANPALLDLNSACWVVTDRSPEAPEERRNCFPEVFYVGGAHLAKNETELTEWMKTVTVDDLARNLGISCDQTDCAALPGESPTIEKASVKTLTIDHDQPSFTVVASKPGYLFLSIPFRFDWSAEVNGQTVRPIRANYAFMAVPIAAGESKVTFTLSHRISYAAVAISLISLALALVIFRKRN